MVPEENNNTAQNSSQIDAEFARLMAAMEAKLGTEPKQDSAPVRIESVQINGEEADSAAKDEIQVAVRQFIDTFAKTLGGSDTSIRAALGFYGAEPGEPVWAYFAIPVSAHIAPTLASYVIGSDDQIGAMISALRTAYQTQLLRSQLSFLFPPSPPQDSSPTS